jgi:hypothetical protein
MERLYSLPMAPTRRLPVPNLGASHPAIQIVFSLVYGAGGVLGRVAQAVHPTDPESPAAEVLVGDTALHEWAATD